MKRRYWMAPALVLVGLFALSISAQGQEKLTWKAFDGKKPFFQKLTTVTNQTLTVSGVDNKQDQTQTFWFKWIPEGKKDGKFKVIQEIVGLEMDINIGGNKIKFASHDKNQPNNPMTQFFKTLVNTKFTLTINPDTMKVEKVDGVADMVKKLVAVNQAMKPLLDKILTEDSVKQMANPVLGVIPPKGEIPKDGKWGDKDWVELNMGPIGTYKTKNSYSVEKDKEKEKVVPITVKTEMVYEKPTGKDAKELPFEIKDADLKSKNSGGEIQFNRDAGRIDSSKLKVNLDGKLTVAIAGTTTNVNLAQVQNVELRTYDEGDAGLPDWLKGQANNNGKDKKEKKEKSK